MFLTETTLKMLEQNLTFLKAESKKNQKNFEEFEKMDIQLLINKLTLLNINFRKNSSKNSLIILLLKQRKSLS